MAIRLPLQTVLNSDNSSEVGAGSVAGGVNIPFTIPQDTDNIVVKFTASVAGGGVSATLQTTDDGGTTWYDVGRTSIVSNANATNAEWLSVPVAGAGVGYAVTQTTSSVYVGSIGKTPASALGSQRMSGLPILSQQARIVLILPAAITSAASNSIVTQVKVNSQSATA